MQHSVRCFLDAWQFHDFIPSLSYIRSTTFALQRASMASGSGQPDPDASQYTDPARPPPHLSEPELPACFGSISHCRMVHCLSREEKMSTGQDMAASAKDKSAGPKRQKHVITGASKAYSVQSALAAVSAWHACTIWAVQCPKDSHRSIDLPHLTAFETMTSGPWYTSCLLAWHR